MMDKIWWHFENFVDFVAKLIKRTKSNDSTKDDPADQCVAVTRDGKVYVGKAFQGEVKHEDDGQDCSDRKAD